MTLVWVTGSPGSGKSLVCARLHARGFLAIDADWEGYCQWVDRAVGAPVVDPPYPVPRGWLDRYGWQIDRSKVAALAGASGAEFRFMCGSVENEDEVRDLFDLVVCLLVDDDTMIRRLTSRSSNSFGAQPEELAAALRWNGSKAAVYEALGATLVDGTGTPDAVVNAVLAATSFDQDRSGFGHR